MIVLVGLFKGIWSVNLNLNLLCWPCDLSDLCESKLRDSDLIYVPLLLPQLDTSILSFEGGISRL